MGINQEKRKRTILYLIRNNKAIKDPSHVSIEIKAAGYQFWKRHEIHILGRVDLEIEKMEIDKIIEIEARGMIVKNSLRVNKS